MSRRVAGFTLLEVLLAVTLLAAALALGFGILRAATATSERGEQMARRNEQMRSASNFLRQRIGGAQPIVLAFDPQSGRSLRFAGDAHSMRFAADLPDYLGRGGPQLHILQVRDGGTGVRLDIDFQRLQTSQALPVARPAEPLAEGLTRVNFAYRTLDERGVLGEWQAEWRVPEVLPLQVRVRIADAQGAWPDIVVALPVASSPSAPTRGSAE